ARRRDVPGVAADAQHCLDRCGRPGPGSATDCAGTLRGGPRRPGGPADVLCGDDGGAGRVFGAAGGTGVPWRGAGGGSGAAGGGGAVYGGCGLPLMVAAGAATTRSGLGAVQEGLAFLVRTPVVRGALLTDLAMTVLSMPISLFPLVNAERFGDDPRTLGLFLS